MGTRLFMTEFIKRIRVPLVNGIAAIMALLFVGSLAEAFSQSKSGLSEKQAPSASKPKPANTTADPKQKPQTNPQPTATPVDPLIEKQRWDAAVAESDALGKTDLLKAFIIDFPESANHQRARELLVVARAAAGDEKFRIGEREAGIALFREALADAPTPFPSRLFDEIISKFPASLFFRGEREEAIRAAGVIEKQVADDAARLTQLANFYLSIEDGTEAKRLAESAIAIKPESADAYQALGLANRLSFDLDAAAAAFAKGAEINPGSDAIKRNLAEMYRALGKPAEAEAIYRELLSVSPGDLAAKTGAILALFDRGERAAAEIELSEALEANPNNVILLAGAALWYAANDDPEKAASYAEKAASLEPRYVWSHIALGRSRMRQNDPLAAERAFLAARRFGNFPTLEYELAEARLSAGFYRDAAEGLAKTFSIVDGRISTRLGGRILREAETFDELLSSETRASVFTALPEIMPETSGHIRALLEFSQLISGAATNENMAEQAAAAADGFTAGTDKMKLHRQLYAASALLERSIAPEKVLALTLEATGTVEQGLEIKQPSAAVMASELYETRQIAFARDEFLKIPEIPRNTLSNILRGRIEELAGWALFRMEKYPESLVRLRRAITVLPEKSAWWRSTLWRLGSAYEANGKPEEALDSYVKAYLDDKPSAIRYVIIESLYKKIKGNTDGLNDLIGPNPFPTVASQIAAAPEDAPTPVTETVEEKKEQPAADQASAGKLPEKIADNTAKPTDDEKALPDAEKSDDPQKNPPPSKSAEAEQTEPNKSEIKPIDETTGNLKPTADKEKEAGKETTSEAKAESTAGTKNVVEPEKEAAKNIKPDAEAGKAAPVDDSANPTAETAASDAAKPPPVVQPTAPQTVFDPIIITFGRKPEESKEPSTTKQSGKPEQQAANNGSEGSSDKPSPAASASENPTEASDAKTNTAVDPTKSVEEKPAESEKNAAEVKNTAEIPVSTEIKPVSESVMPLVESASLPAVPGKHTINDAPQAVNLARGAHNETSGENELKPMAANAEGAKSEITVSGSPQAPSVNTPPPGIPENGAAADKKEKPAAESPDAAKLSGGTNRERMVTPGVSEADKPVSRCWIFVSKENIEAAASGSDVGLLIGIDGGEASSIEAKTTNADDIEIRLTNEVAGVAGRAFLVVRSKSGKPGTYRILLSAPCDRKEITVTVR